MPEDSVRQTLRSGAPLSAAVHQRDAPKGYKMFKEQQDEATKAVLEPDWRKEVA